MTSDNPAGGGGERPEHRNRGDRGNTPERRRHPDDIPQHELDRDAEHARHYSTIPRDRPHCTPTEQEKHELETIYGRPWTEFDRLRHLGTDVFLPEHGSQLETFTPERGARGILLDSANAARNLESGRAGPARDIGAPAGLNLPEQLAIVTHVEAHAAAAMRSSNEPHATLYLNRRPCRTSYGCDTRMPTMLPTGGTLQVYYLADPSRSPFDPERETGPWFDQHGREWRGMFYNG